MRDSDLAIGVVVLAAVIAGLLYFLFSTQLGGIGQWLRGPSHTQILKSIEAEKAKFSRETEIISSYLERSFPLKAYRLIDLAFRGEPQGRTFKLNDYPAWTLKMNAERESLLDETVKAAARHGKSADALLLALEARRSLRDRIKESQAKRDTKALDREISDLQTRLDGERDSLIVIRDQFSEKRRSLNQQVLREWFIRSLLVGVLVAVFLSGSCWFITKSPTLYGAQTKTSYQTRVPSAPGIFSFFRPKATHQSALLRPGEGCVLRGSAFRFTIQPKSASIPHVITMALKGLPKSKTALKLASILGGNPDTPASPSHHLSEPGGLITHTAKALKHSKPLLTMLPDPKIGPVAILAHDIGKVFTLEGKGAGRPHDIPGADILASLPELREEFDATTARSLLLAIRHQHSNAEIPLNAPPLTHTILQFIKKADHAAAAEESREAAEETKLLAPKIIEAFPFAIADLNVNGCNGGSPEGFLCDGTLFLLKEPVKQRLLRHLNARDGGVFKGQDPVWNEIANALAEAKLITKKIGAKEAGQKSCLFAIKTPMGQQRAIALHASNLAPQLREKWLMGNIPKIEIL